MLIITISVDTAGDAMGVKEDLAMICEKYGDVVKVDVKEVAPQQMSFGEIR